MELAFGVIDMVATFRPNCVGPGMLKAMDVAYNVQQIPGLSIGGACEFDYPTEYGGPCCNDEFKVGMAGEYSNTCDASSQCAYSQMLASSLCGTVQMIKTHLLLYGRTIGLDH